VHKSVNEVGRQEAFQDEVAIVRIALPVALEREFDYLARLADRPTPGCWVDVEFGRQRCRGVITELPTGSSIAREKLKLVLALHGDVPVLDERQLGLARFISRYYQVPLGQALALLAPPRQVRGEPGSSWVRITAPGRTMVLPARATMQRRLQDLLRDGNPRPSAEAQALGATAAALVRRWLREGWLEPAEPPLAREIRQSPMELTREQAAALSTICAALGSFQTILLHGVTGSGKTLVYLRAAAEAIGRGGQVLLLVPEINLTPQLADYLHGRLPGVRLALLHSGLSDSDRWSHWKAAASGAAQLVVGTRLAVLAPLPRLALIIVDEEHDASFKQQDGVRYHARDVALYRGQQEALPVVLGSATPALETYQRARGGHYRLATLAERPGGASLPLLKLVPAKTSLPGQILGPEFLAAMALRLERREQSMLFINRRGFAPSLLCAACAWSAPCTRCEARLVVHLASGRLRCHHCGQDKPLPRRCPVCGNADLAPTGHGTQRLEAHVRAHFPAARILRVDSDSTSRRNAWPGMLAAIQRGDADVLVGTQMLAKGHDFPLLTLVGVLGADNALYSADFRATERAFAQLMQVAGRAGRADRPGEVIVQTDFPGHPVYRALLDHDYDALALSLLAERKSAMLPPFSFLALLRAEAHARRTVDAFLQHAHRLAHEKLEGRKEVHVYDPVPAPMARRAGYERGHLLFQAAERKPLIGLLRELRLALRSESPASRVRWGFDVDPVQLD
jgi:primosomal protein N' (replication factor Y)